VRNRDRVIEADDLAISERSGRIEHGPFNAHVIEEIEPTLGSYGGPLVALRRGLYRSPRMEMIKRGKNNAFALRDLPVRAIHVGDDRGVVLHDVAVAIDNSGCELRGHAYNPPTSIEIGRLFFLIL
jgi:hypothetical protein